MKEDTNLIEVTTFGGTGEQFEMSIDEDSLAHIMGIMSKLYSNPMLAVIREYSTNAFDSHVAVGKKDVPIEVTLPSSMDSQFSVQDYGLGLTKDEVRTVFSSYGKSTKRNSNDFNGQLGFGSKSAFAYSDQFNVTAVKDGVKCYISFSLNESKVGVANVLGEEETTEPNGVKISIPIKMYDIYAFNRTANEFYANWLVSPIGVLKASNIFWPDEFAGPDVRLRANTTGNAVLVMGNVTYPIDMNQIPCHNTKIYTDAYLKYSTLLCAPLVITAGIGDVSFSPSRESLQYNKKTVAWIENKLKDIVAGLEVYAEDYFSRSGNVVQQHERYIEFTQNFPSGWGQHVFNRCVSVRRRAVNPSKDSYDLTYFVTEIPNTTSATLRISKKEKIGLTDLKRLKFLYLPEMTEVEVLDHIGGKDYIPRIIDLPTRKILKNSRGNTFRIINTPLDPQVIEDLGIDFLTIEDLKQIPVKTPPPPRKVDNYSPLLQMSLHETGWTSAWIRYLATDTYRLPDDGAEIVYIELVGNSPQDHKITHYFSSVKDLSRRADIRFYGIRESKVEAMSKKYKLVTLEDYLVREHTKLMDKPNNYNYEYISKLEGANLDRLRNLYPVLDYIETVSDPDTVAFLNQLKAFREIDSKAEADDLLYYFKRLSEWVSPYSNVCTVSLDKYFSDFTVPTAETFSKKYPLFVHCSQTILKSAKGIEEFIHYMNSKETI